MYLLASEMNELETRRLKSDAGFTPARPEETSLQINQIILASHGTNGARAAETAAIDLAAENGASLHQLFVVPDFWKGMMGDDWLNNAVTQIRFGNYVENQLAKEAAVEIDRVAEMAAEKSIPYSCEIQLGKPADCLIEECNKGNFDIAIIGSPRPKGTPGYRSRMVLEKLARGLDRQFIIIPHPDR